MTESFVPARNPAAYTVEMDGEAVILDESIDRLHLLNSTAALIWACVDGVSTVEEICQDLADGLGAPYEQVLADTRTVIDQLLAETLLHDATAVPPAAEVPPSRRGALADGRLEDPPSP